MNPLRYTGVHLDNLFPYSVMLAELKSLKLSIGWLTLWSPEAVNMCVSSWQDKTRQNNWIIILQLIDVITFQFTEHINRNQLPSD